MRILNHSGYQDNMPVQVTKAMAQAMASKVVRVNYISLQDLRRLQLKGYTVFIVKGAKR